MRTEQRGMTKQSIAGSMPSAAGSFDLSLLSQRIFAPYKLATLIETVQARDISADTVLARTDLTLDHVHNPRTLTSVKQYFTACDNAIAAGADVNTAFAVGSRLHLSAYGMYGYALMCSPTMREFFDFAVRYHLLATPALRLGWRQENGCAIWEFTEIYGDAMSEELRGFLVRQQMMQTFTHIRDVAGATHLPVRALFALAKTANLADDEHLLKCPCLFGQRVHELHYPASILDQAPEFGNRLTRAMLEETCDRLIGQAKGNSGIAGEIYRLLMRAPDRLLSMHAVALQMGMTERTLRRRLTDADCSYAGIVDEVRKSLALEYLRTTRISVDDIAWKIGFSDGSNLRRAIKRWTGKTIGEIRRK